MLSKVLSIGNKIELINVLQRGGTETSNGNEKKIYYSQIHDIIDDKRLKIGMPIEGGKVIPLNINFRFDACFYTANGLYQCRIVIVDRYKEGNMFVLIVEPLSELKRYQRRQYYRLGCTMDIKYRVIEKDEVEDYVNSKDKREFALKKPLINGVALDISGGGIRFISQHKHDRENDMFLWLEITYNGQEKIYGIIGRIVAMERLRNKEATYEYRIEYKNIEGIVREELIKFIFEEERKQRQKERGKG